MKNAAVLYREINPVKSGNCVACRLYSACRPAGTSDYDFREVEAVFKQLKPIQKNSFVYREGDFFSHLYIVRSGSIKVYQTSPDGDERVTGFVFPGEMFGLDGFSSGRYARCATAMDTSSICKFSISELESFGKKGMSIINNIFRIVSQKMLDEQLSRILLSRCTAMERIALFIFEVSAKYARIGSSSLIFRLPMSRGEIANYLGLTIETTSRVFSRLQKDGFIFLKGKELILMNPTGLKEMVSGVKYDLQ